MKKSTSSKPDVFVMCLCHITEKIEKQWEDFAAHARKFFFEQKGLSLLFMLGDLSYFKNNFIMQIGESLKKNLRLRKRSASMKHQTRISQAWNSELQSNLITYFLPNFIAYCMPQTYNNFNKFPVENLINCNF